MTKYSDDFNLFWRGYPKRFIDSSGAWVKLGKYEASVVWKRLSKADRKAIMKVLPKLKAGKYVPDAHRWLKKRRWEDFDIDELPQHKRDEPPQKDSELDYSDKIQNQLNKLGKSMNV